MRAQQPSANVSLNAPEAGPIGPPPCTSATDCYFTLMVTVNVLLAAWYDELAAAVAVIFTL